MQPQEFMDFVHILEGLKCRTRHSYTSTLRHESVAEHTFRIAAMALLLEGEFPGLDMAKVIKMCLVHDWGEAVTGDIPSFLKTDGDEEREAEERAEAEERERRERRRRSSTFWQLFSGTILVREGVSKYYPYMLTIAGMFFLSIMVMFWSLHLDMRYTRLERDVQKLRERSIRLQEQRYQRTTHSAIVEQLRARGIELYDPQAPGEIIEN